MITSEKITFDLLVQKGNAIDIETIDPERDKDNNYCQPHFEKGKKLYALSEDGGGDDRKITDVTTEKQFDAFIRKAKNGKLLPLYLSEVDTVFIRYYEL
ncbi:MAG: hypothetical protein WDK96_01720 [Candidatus Paceibacterota bacterium]|jgi:hypothetical protein